MTLETENADRNQSQEKPWQFQPGHSGNPAGKPKGARHKTTLAVQALLEGEAEAITRKAIEAAKAGDMTAIRLIIERILPAKKDTPISIDIPPIRTLEDALSAVAMVIDSVASGEITPSEAQSVIVILEQWRKSYETNELEARLKALEERTVL